MQQLLDYIKVFYPLPEVAQDALKNNFERIELTKTDYLIRQTQIARYMYFLEKGALRGYYILDGKEITHWFAFENDFVTSFHSFITQTPAVENIQLMESAVLWRISREKLTALYNAHHEIERVVRIAYEKYYIKLEERFVNAHFKTAKELYNDLMLQRPHILERVPLGYIASYLGISQETLSRIRGKL